MPTTSVPSRIGVFDSGVGGLSVLRAIRHLLPTADLRYVADARYAPYGERDEATIRSRAERVAAHLVAGGAKLVVVACNTATAVAIDGLRAAHPRTAFVGVEPGVRPAVAASVRRRIGIMATDATLGSARFTALLAREAADCQVHLQACPGLAAAVERGRWDDPQLRALIERYAGSLREYGVDVVALGCTHYSFVRDEIARALGDHITIIDTAQAVAAQVARLWSGAAGASRPTCLLETTGDPRQLGDFAAHWLDIRVDVSPLSLVL
jgi:glutamate racemase